MLKKIFFTIISLSAIFLVPTYNVNALEYSDIVLDQQTIYYLYDTINNYQYNGTTQGPSFCQYGVAIVWDNTSTTYKAYCNYWGPFSSQYNSNNVLPPLDRTSNYLGLTNFTQFQTYEFTGSKSPRLVLYYDVNDGWLTECVFTACSTTTYTLNTGDYVTAFLDFYPNNNKTKSWVYNKTENDILFNVNYNNFYYYSALNNWSESNYSYLLTPDIVLGSHDSFDSEDLTSVPSSSYSNYNNYMYTIDSVDSDFSLLGVTFGYNYYSDNNYKLGFVLTYKKATDIPPLVYAKTNIGIYSCSSSVSVKSKNDTTYQWYVECPSVAFSNDENEGYLYIMVQGAYDFDYTTGPSLVYDFNTLFYTGDGVVGISPILKSVTSTTPTPILPPDTPEEPTIIDSIDDMNNNIMDTSAPDTSKLNNSAGWLPPGPVDSIINLPLNMFSSLASVLNNNLCTPVVVPLPFLNNSSISLPCIDTLINAMGFSTFWSWVGGIVSGIILYNYLIKYYKWIDNTLTFRENNWSDWGGI